MCVVEMCPQKEARSPIVSSQPIASLEDSAPGAFVGSIVLNPTLAGLKAGIRG